MTPMSLQTIDEILDAIEHLPRGASLVIPQVDWEDYELLLENFGKRHLHVSYDSGRLEIVSPLPRHEMYGRFFDSLVREFATAHKLTVEMLGQTTWKRRALAKGVEADACYYVQNAERVIGKEDLDLEIDPPPDIAVEIDITSNSLRKLAIYAALSVPEIWRYNGKTIHMYTLAGSKYVEIAGSNILPGLTGSLLAELIELSRTHGQTKALEAFRRQIQSLQ